MAEAKWSRRLSATDQDLVDRLIREYRSGNISKEEYEATKADIAANPTPDQPERRSVAATDRRFLKIVGGLVVILLVAWLLSLCSDSGGGADGALRPTEAEVACERGVRNQVGGSPSFSHALTSEITGGFEVYGRASLDGADFGYMCTVTGRSGSPTTSVEITY